MSDLLKQARVHWEYGRGCDPGSLARGTWLAVGRLLEHLEREAAMSGPAQVPGVVKCKECGLHRQHWVHDLTRVGYSDPEHPELESHVFDPETLADRVVALEAMSESHTHNIASLFIDFDALQKPRPAQVPSEPAHPNCYDVNGNPRCGICGHPEVSHLMAPSDHDFVMPGKPAQVPGEPKCKVCGEPRSFGHGEEPDEHSCGAGDHDFVPPRALDLDELQRLCDAATRGPWKMCPKRVYFLAADGSPVCDIDDFDNYGPIELRGHGAEVSGNRPEGSMDANADFICAARDALPKLIAKVKELEVEAAYWHKEWVTANNGKPCPPLEEAFKWRTVKKP